MIRTLAIAAGLAVGVSSAQAAFTGILIQEGDSAGASAVTGTDTILLRVWAMFDGPGTQTALPGGNSNMVLNSNNVNINSSGSFFVQDTTGVLGANRVTPAIVAPPNGAFNGFGSWGTIGILNSLGTPIAIDPGTDVANALGEGNAASNFGNGGGFRNDNPPNNAGLAGNGPQPVGSADFGLLLFQLVITGAGQGDGTLSSFSGVGTGIFLDQFGNKVTDTFADDLGGLLSGEFRVAVRDPQTPLTHRIQFGGQPPIPTPGSLALFGLAGLAAARRRR